MNHNVTIEKAEVIPDRHGEHIEITFNEDGKIVTKKTKPWALLSAMRHYEEKYTTSISLADISQTHHTN